LCDGLPVVHAGIMPGALSSLTDALAAAYPWTKVLHIVAMVAWMAGLFYLPRLFVYHSERAQAGGELAQTFEVMERKLLRGIMNPAMIATWTLGILLALTPGLVDWNRGWIYVKLATVAALTVYHHWLGRRRKDFLLGENRLSGRSWRLVNELPLVALVIIVTMVVVRPF
jgi:putative membrane protein